MSNVPIKSSELILNERGSIYHLDLLPEEVGSTVITVGDPERVGEVSKNFDSVDIRIERREFHTHTGMLGSKRISVISTGIGTDNIDIVLNELDALVNIDFKSRQVKSKHTSLNIIRIGTSGSISLDIPVNSFLVSEAAIGLDALGSYYNSSEKELELNLKSDQGEINVANYFIKASSVLLEKRPSTVRGGITVTAPGFYGPQGRSIRLKGKFENIIDQIVSKAQPLQLTNLEMETAGIYLLADLLGHQAISFNAILANRKSGTFSENPQRQIDALIKMVLNWIKEEL